MRARALVAIVVIAAFTALGCSGPHRGARTIGAAGAMLAFSGGTAWVVGARTDSDALMVPGVVGALAGVAMMVVAGAMMAREVACDVDAECPIGNQCREVPAAAGRIPYSQCVPR